MAKLRDIPKAPKKVLSIFVGELTYQNAYVWFIFVSAMDIIITTGVLYLDGEEVNPIARAVIEAFGKPGMIVFKFVLVGFIIAICEFVGRRKYRAGLVVIYLGIIVTGMTVLFGTFVLTQAIQRAVSIPGLTE